MLRLKNPFTGADCTAALDEDGGHVTLTLSQGDLCFRRTLTAEDAGRILNLVPGELLPRGRWEGLFDGDLEAHFLADGTLVLSWGDDQRPQEVFLSQACQTALREALKGYCRLLMRSDRGRA